MKKFILYIVLLLFFILDFFFLFKIYKIAIPFWEETFYFSVLMGLLGSLVYMTRGFYKSIIDGNGENSNFDFKWIWWYLCRPLLGIVVGGLVFLITYTAFDLNGSVQNEFAIGLLSFLGGYNFTLFMNKKIENK